MQRPKGLAGPYPAQWEDPAMAEAYPARLPYSESVIDQLASLVGGTSPILDVGSGTGDLARPLASRGFEVHAVERSPAMIAVAQRRPGGDAVRFTPARIETAPLDPSYALAVAGESVHWFDWDRAMPRIRDALAPYAWFAVVSRRDRLRGAALLHRLIAQWSTNQDFEPYDAVELLVTRGWFEPAGRWQAAPTVLHVPIATWLLSLHSRNGFGPGRMGLAAKEAFDREASAILEARFPDGHARVDFAPEVVWGRIPDREMRAIVQ
ncbi:MAG: class I SAM-dependent methyltransferase [Myxococcota bacterium]